MKKFGQIAVLLAMMAVASTSWAQGAPQAKPSAKGQVKVRAQSVLVHVIGEVRVPGGYKPQERTSLSEALARCGGLLIAPGQAEITVYRAGKQYTIDVEALIERGDASQDMWLQGGDLVLVSKAKRASEPPEIQPVPRSFSLDALIVPGASEQEKFPNWHSFRFNGMTLYIVPLKSDG